MTKNLKSQVEYWVKTSQHDYKTMLGLFRIKRYSDCLFYGHIVLEKILKALVVYKTKKYAPYTHDLVYLVNLAGLKLTNSQLNLLDRANRFNIRARYPDARLEFYKICNRKYAEKYLKQIKVLYKFLCQKIKL
ncbi:HEPN domain-containing protein [Patescibacteria group bacterium AH-259-L07]|nr:HEPN domain-containing protein [Patescibacteria group bacterium AH-259-L07]